MTDEREAEAAKPEYEHERRPEGSPDMKVREDDLEPHEGLRYIATLFKVLAVILLLLLVAEIIIGLVTAGMGALHTLMVEATRLIVFAGILWGGADLALMLIESNHDLRATRILVGRLNGRVRRMEEQLAAAGVDPATGEPSITSRRPSPDG